MAAIIVISKCGLDDEDKRGSGAIQRVERVPDVSVTQPWWYHGLSGPAEDRTCLDAVSSAP